MLQDHSSKIYVKYIGDSFGLQPILNFLATLPPNSISVESPMMPSGNFPYMRRTWNGWGTLKSANVRDFYNT